MRLRGFDYYGALCITDGLKGSLSLLEIIRLLVHDLILQFFVSGMSVMTMVIVIVVYVRGEGRRNVKNNNEMAYKALEMTIWTYYRKANADASVKQLKSLTHSHRHRSHAASPQLPFTPHTDRIPSIMQKDLRRKKARLACQSCLSNLSPRIKIKKVKNPRQGTGQDRTGERISRDET